MCKEATVNLTNLTHWQRAYYLAQMANDSYLLPGNAAAVTADTFALLAEKLATLGFQIKTPSGNLFFEPTRHSEGFITTTPTDVVIVIKGTWELEDWQTNVQLWQEAYGEGGQVHAGFKTAALALMAMLTPALRQSAEDRAKPLWLTGHSSGGAIAVLLAHAFHLLNIDVAGVYTYGAPKVGDSVYARSYPLRTRLHAYKTAGDIVPALPASHYQLHDWTLRYTEYVHIVEPEQLMGIIHSPAPGVLDTVGKPPPLQGIAALAIANTPHSLTGAYIPLLAAEKAPVY